MKIAIVITMIGRGHWHSRCPSLPGCEATGASRRDVLLNLEPAIRGYISSLDAAFPPDLNLAVSPV